jgi:cytochrome c-type biogenesis protein CcmE
MAETDVKRAPRKLAPALFTLAVVMGGIAYLFYSSAGEAFEYYKHVDELAANPGAWTGKHLQMHGFVVPGSIAKRMDASRQQIEYKFQAVNCEKIIEVRYAGTVPDTFKDRAEVVVKGTLDGSQFHASEISAKCPSKYQSRPDGPAQTLCTRGDKSL